MKYRCPRSGCGREFDSPRALAIHMAKTHGERRSQSKTPERVSGPPELTEALKALGIQEVLAFKIYDDRVVVIEGPGGKKRVWQKPKEEVVRGAR